MHIQYKVLDIFPAYPHSFQVADMASYDDTGVTNYRFSYCLEAGDYHFYMGTSVKKVVELLDETGKNFM